MSDIHSINPNSPLDSTFSAAALDPKQISWEPVKRGGANFKTHILEFEGDKARVKKSLGFTLFCGIFITLGVVLTLIVLPILIFQGETGGGFAVGGAGLIFGIVGYVMMNSSALCFDHQSGYYYSGKGLSKVNSGKQNKQGKLEDIVALQIISEWVVSHSNNGGSNSYNSYELNLVFSDGERANVMDHGNADSLEKDADRLGDFLAIPIWRPSS